MRPPASLYPRTGRASIQAQGVTHAGCGLLCGAIHGADCMYDSAAEHAGCGLLCGAIHGADCMYDSAAEHVNADRREEERDRTAGQSDEDEKQLPTGSLLAV